MAVRRKKSSSRIQEEARSGRVRVLISFNGMYAGDEADTEIDAQVMGWVNAGYMRIVDRGTDGTHQARPGVDPAVDQGREPQGAEGSEPAGGEPGEDPVSR